MIGGGISVLVIGHSHVDAVREAARLRRSSGAGSVAVRTIHMLDPAHGGEFVSRQEPLRYTPGLLATVADQVARHQPVIASMIGGNTHNVLSLVERDPPFDFHLSGEPSPKLNPRAALRSEDAAHAWLKDELRTDLARLTLLREAAGRFVQIESPPPVAARSFIARRLEPFFRADPAFERNGVAPGGVRYRMWRLASHIYAEHCGSLGCAFLPCPAVARDESGFLDRRYAANSTHANGLYGEAVIRQLEERLAAGRVGWPAP